jgi:hypothetical protein
VDNAADGRWWSRCGTQAVVSEVDAPLGHRLPLLHVEAPGIDRPLAGRRARILHDQDLAAGRGVEHALEMRVEVVEHRARRAQPAVDRERALQDEPDLREAVIVLGMMRARLELEDAGIGRGRLLRRRVEQHLAGLARPADRLPVDLVEMAHLVGQMIAPRGLARGVEGGIGRRRVGNVLAASLAHGQQSDAIGGQQQTADPGHPKAEREQLFNQHHGGQDGDPQQVHHAADEQQRHQDPAAAEAVEAVAEAHAQGAGGAVPPVVDDEVERRPADKQAGLLERRQLVEAGGEEQQAAEPRAGRRHVHRREQGQPLEAPLGERRGHAEAAPRQEVAGGKQRRRRIRPGTGALAPVDGGEGQDHRRRAGQHHAGHHDPPHRQQQDEIDGAFRFHRHRHGHGAHRPHIGRRAEQVEPAERGEAAERRGDHDALAQHQVEQRRGGRWVGPVHLRRSGRPGKRREVPVVALAGEAEAKPEALHFGLLRARQGETAVGRVGGVVDVEGLAGAVARGHALDLEGQNARDLGRAAQAFGGEVDPAEFDAAEVAHQVVADHLRRAA